MSNPFEIIDQRLSNIEVLLLDIKHAPKVVPELTDHQKFHGDRELGKYLNCSVQTVNTLKKNGQITFHRMGRRCYYLRSEIDRDLQVSSRRFGKGGK